MDTDSQMMDWNRLINDKRFGLEDFHDPKRGSRTRFWPACVFISVPQTSEQDAGVSFAGKHLRS